MHKQDLLTDFPALNLKRELHQIKGIEEEDDENLPFNKKPKAQPKPKAKAKAKGKSQPKRRRAVRDDEEPESKKAR